MIWLLIDGNEQVLDKMETGRRQVCNKSFGCVSVDGETALLGGFHVTVVSLAWPGCWEGKAREGDYDKSCINTELNN